MKFHFNRMNSCIQISIQAILFFDNINGIIIYEEASRNQFETIRWNAKANKLLVEGILYNITTNYI